MTTSVEHKVAMHQLAAERRAQGKPQWEHTIKGFRAALNKYDHKNPDDDMLRAIRDELVALIKASRWYLNADEYSDLREAVDELADVAGPEIFSTDSSYDPERHFNAVLNALYDFADYDRVWLG